MPKPNHDLHIDFETYCDLDLKKVGVHRYVAHPSFRVLCMAWKLDGRAAASTIGGVPPDLRQHLQSPDVQGHAFNAAFETAVLERLGVFAANPLSCTMEVGVTWAACPGSWKRRGRRWPWRMSRTWRATG